MNLLPHDFIGCEFFLVNGIRTRDDITAWVARAETWYQERAGSATRYPYFTWALTRFLTQGKHVRAINEKLCQITKPVIYVGHSNGCELFSRVIRAYPGRHFAAAHLFAPACSPDFRKNGFNRALERGQIGSLYIYGSRGDSVLGTWAKVSRIAKPLGLGYESLGYEGPSWIKASVAARVVQTWRDEFDHNDWFERPDDFQRSMEWTVRK